MNYSANTSSGKVYDVLIVGAGPVGLATAIGLQKRGVNNLLVIDKAREFRQVGQTVDLLPNGLKAINYIESLAYKKIKESGLNGLSFSNTKTLETNKNETDKQKKLTQKRYWYHKNLQGEIIHSVALDFETYFNKYGEGRVSIPWHELQTNLRDFLSPDLIKINHRCVNLHQNADFVTIDCVSDSILENNPFAHWEMKKSSLTNDENQKQEKSDQVEKKQFRAKLVVAADGINSAIRQVLYDNTNLSQWAKPQYSGWAAIACFAIDNIPCSLIEQLEKQYFQGQSVITISNDKIKANSSLDESPRIILINRKKNQIGYLLHIPLALESLQNKSTNDLIELILQKLEKSEFSPIIKQLVSLSNPENLVKRPYYIHPANIPTKDPIWSNKRVVLVGDAAHGMPPFIAQGANQGLEDSVVISTLIGKIIENQELDNQNIISQQWAKYEQIRRQFMAKVQEATMQNYCWSQQQWDNYSEMVYGRNLEHLANSL